MQVYSVTHWELMLANALFFYMKMQYLKISATLSSDKWIIINCLSLSLIYQIQTSDSPNVTMSK